MNQPPAYDKAAYGAPQQGYPPPMQGQGYAPPMQGQGYAPPMQQSNVHVMMHSHAGAFGKDPVTTTCRNCQANVSVKFTLIIHFVCHSLHLCLFLGLFG